MIAIEAVPFVALLADALVCVACIVYLTVDVRRFLREPA